MHTQSQDLISYVLFFPPQETWRMYFIKIKEYTKQEDRWNAGSKGQRTGDEGPLRMMARGEPVPLQRSRPAEQPVQDGARRKVL